MLSRKNIFGAKTVFLLMALTFLNYPVSLAGIKDSLAGSKSNFDKAKIYLHASRNLINKNIDSCELLLKAAKKVFPTILNYTAKKENRLKTELILLEGDFLIKVGKLNDAKVLFHDLLTTHKDQLLRSENADALLQLGVISDYQSQPVAALKYYEKAYKIYDSLNDLKGTSECYNNMGIIYYRQGELEKGIEYLEKCVAIRKAAKHSKSSIAVLLENLGSMYMNTGKIELAKKYYDEGLDLYSEANDSWGIAYALKNLARYNIKMKNYDKALEQCNTILNNYSGISDSSGISMINSILSDVYLKKGDYKKSIACGQLAYSIAMRMDVALRVYEAAGALKNVYAEAGDYKEALKFTNLYMMLKDSLSNNKSEKESLKQRLEHEKEVEHQLLKKDLQIKEAEAKRKNLVLVFVSFGLVIIILFSGLLLKKFREAKKQKLIIEEQKLEVEHKQKEMLDSINYARRIQQTLLPTQKYLAKSINRLKK